MKQFYEYENLPCGIANIEFVDVVRDKNFKMPFPEGREKSGFIFVQRGQLSYKFAATEQSPAKEWILTAGKTVFVPSGTVYTATYLEDGTNIIVAQFDLVYGELPKVLQRPRRVPMQHAERHIKELFKYRSMSLNGHSRSYWCIYKMYEIIWNAVNCLEDIAPKFKKLSPALNDIQNNFSVQRPIRDYADMCSMSEPGFRRLFVEYTGMSPVEYRNEIRLEEARRLIGTGEYLVEEAANAVGFSNISFFCRCFKKRFGHTPLGVTAHNGD